PHAGIYIQNAGDGIVKHWEQRIEDERDDGGMRADTAEDGNGNQKSEQSQARNGLYDIDHAECHIAPSGSPAEDDAERNRHNRSEEHGNPDQEEVLRGQRDKFMQETVRHHTSSGCRQLRNAHASGVDACKNSRGGPTNSIEPLSRTAIRVPRKSASRTS